jgi:hypothetical protein
METAVKLTRVVTLVLQEDEAIWLQSVMQNSFSESNLEDPVDTKYRELFFNTLQDSLPI